MSITFKPFMLETLNFTHKHMNLCTVWIDINNLDNIPSTLHLATMFPFATFMPITPEIYVMETSFFAHVHQCILHFYINILTI